MSQSEVLAKRAESELATFLFTEDIEVRSVDRLTHEILNRVGPYFRRMGQLDMSEKMGALEDALAVEIDPSDMYPQVFEPMTEIVATAPATRIISIHAPSFNTMRQMMGEMLSTLSELLDIPVKDLNTLDTYEMRERVRYTKRKIAEMDSRILHERLESRDKSPQIA